jgi:hypothetical protein
MSACTFDTQEAQDQSIQDTDELTNGYHPSVRYGTLVSADKKYLWQG